MAFEPVRRGQPFGGEFELAPRWTSGTGQHHGRTPRPQVGEVAVRRKQPLSPIQSPPRGRQSRSRARRSSPSAARSRGSRSPSAARDHGGRVAAPTIGVEVARPALIVSRPSGGGNEPVRVCRLTEASTNYGPDSVPPRTGPMPSASAFFDRGVSVDICRRYNSGCCTNEDCVRAHRCYHCLGTDHLSGDCQVPFDTCADILAENIRSGGMQAHGRGGKGGRGHRG